MNNQKKEYNTKYYEDRNYLDLRIAESIKILMNDNNLKTVLDVGCGTGLLVKYLLKNKFKAAGCDIEKEAIISAKKLNKIDVIKASATKIPIKKNSYDLITSISVIEHLTPADVEKFIKESKRIIKPNGYIFIVTPNLATPIRIIHGRKWFGYSDPTHINFYTPKSLAHTLQRLGFKSIKTSFKSKYDLPFDWDLPGFFRKLPKPVVYFLTYLLVATPFANIRNSFWMAAQKND